MRGKQWKEVRLCVSELNQIDLDTVLPMCYCLLLNSGFLALVFTLCRVPVKVPLLEMFHWKRIIIDEVCLLLSCHLAIKQRAS